MRVLCLRVILTSKIGLAVNAPHRLSRQIVNIHPEKRLKRLLFSIELSDTSVPFTGYLDSLAQGGRPQSYWNPGSYECCAS
jgi:hypothetical protein